MRQSVEDISADSWHQRLDLTETRARWAQWPHMIEMLDEYVAAMASGDELWTFRYGGCTGIAIRRDGLAVKNHLYLHAH